MSDISNLPDSELNRLADILKALAHPCRMKILCHLREESRNVTQLQNDLGEGQPIISQQLKILRMNGLVESARRDGHVYYEISTEKETFLRAIMENLCQCLRK